MALVRPRRFNPIRAVAPYAALGALSPYIYKQWTGKVPTLPSLSLAKKMYNGYKTYPKQTFKPKDSAKTMTTNASSGRILKKKKSVGNIKKPTVKTLAKAVKKLRIATESDQGVLTYRWRQTYRCLSSVNGQSLTNVPILLNGVLETILAQLRYYNPSTPTTLVTADGASGTFMKDFTFDKIYTSIVCRNNYQVPVKVRVYLCKVKDDTSIEPTTAFSNGLADIGNPSSTSPLVYLTDSPQFTDLWKIHSSEIAQLQPGEEMKMSYTVPTFQYDPSLVDSHNQAYQTRYHGCVFVVRTEGVLGHDTSADQQGTLAAGVDIQMDRTFVVKYSAGADIEYLVVNDESDTFTNGGVTSQKPIPDNIAYSVS